MLYPVMVLTMNLIVGTSGLRHTMSHLLFGHCNRHSIPTRTIVTSHTIPSTIVTSHNTQSQVVSRPVVQYVEETRLVGQPSTLQQYLVEGSRISEGIDAEVIELARLLIQERRLTSSSVTEGFVGN